MALEHEKAKLLTDVPKLIDFLIQETFEYRPEAVDKVLRAAGAGEILEELAKRLQALEPFDAAGVEALCKTLAKERGVKVSVMVIQTPRRDRDPAIATKVVDCLSGRRWHSLAASANWRGAI